MVYASEHLSLAVLELLAHLNPERLPVNLMAYEIEIPDEAVELLDPAHLHPGWIVDAFHRQTREIGDRWTREGRGLALIVPSAIVSAERNVLINPEHPDATSLRVVSQEPFAFDPRLLRR